MGSDPFPGSRAPPSPRGSPAGTFLAPRAGPTLARTTVPESDEPVRDDAALLEAEEAAGASVPEPKEAAPEEVAQVVDDLHVPQPRRSPRGARRRKAQPESSDAQETCEPDASIDTGDASSGDAAASELEAGDETEDAASEPDPVPDANADDRALPALPDDATPELVGRVAAALVFASDRPIPAARLAQLLGQPQGRLRSALEGFAERLRTIESPFALTEIAGGYRFLTDPALARWVAGLRGEQKRERLSAAALETLAIVAYRQPVSKSEIEAMRGVQVGPILRSLLERGLVRVTGRAPVPGRPLQYGTTREFLDRFHLSTLKDLPTVEELTRS